jgi:acetyltransferase-like isoleucine patch superfamily enzyme
MPNTNIGKGCIVASHSYVEGVFPDFSIIGGVPAKVIGSTKDKDEVFLKEFPELRNTYMK